MKKKKIILLGIAAACVLALAFFFARAIVAKKNVKRPLSIEKIHEEEGVPVKVSAPERQNLEDILPVDGTVEAAKTALVVPRVDQLIEAIAVDEGEPVRQGDTVVSLSREAARSSTRASQSALEEAERDFGRAQELFKSGAVARQDLDQARVALDSAEALHQARLESLGDTSLASPLDGFVSRRYQEPGELATKGKPILEIVAIEEVEVDSLVAETEIKDVRVGQPARITVDAYPGRVWEEKITTINPTAREVSRLFTVKVKVPNPESLLKPGMYARVEIIRNVHRNVMLLPQEAVIEDTAGRAGVFLLRGDNTVKFQPVTTGISRKGLLEIKSGLDDSCRVVTSGQERLSDGTKIRVSQ